MNRSWNHIELMGNLTHDPELRKTATKGTSVCRFRLATNRRFRDPQGALQEEPSFHTIIAWATLAEQCAKLLKKGSPVFVSGRLSYRDYTKDDEKRSVTEIIIDVMIVLDKKASEPAAATETPVASPAPTLTAEELADEIPF